ncbi:DUF1146 domain-containing protein [Acholeplasma equifetale]|uniref:DUF1146 domain-containing protein n=1 Tax=Acholeplasma equifetale TaxID=264634 RepID=UPI00047D748F|nr:DUF1146 domain-containing protein [Acholeplasma equifetale]
MFDIFIYVVFWTVFAAGFVVTFRILQSIEIERIFKKYRLFEIKAAYLIISILVGYLLAKFLIDVIHIFPWN